MKISKLFHWLYGFLMLMPVIAVLFSCLFAIINENAYQSIPANYDLLETFYTSVEGVRTHALFSWANTSFLVAPFEYILDLFGCPTNTPIITFLSYWLSVSIIWLVFDVVMYIPLLVHRWLDKGVIE